MHSKLKNRLIRKVDRQLRDSDVDVIMDLYMDDLRYSMINPLDWGWPENIMQ